MHISIVQRRNYVCLDQVVIGKCERWLNSRYNLKVNSLRSPDGLKVECEKSRRIMEGPKVQSLIHSRHTLEILIRDIKIHMLYAHSHGSVYITFSYFPSFFYYSSQASDQ